jgi:hypothetical protein
VFWKKLLHKTGSRGGFEEEDPRFEPRPNPILPSLGYETRKHKKHSFILKSVPLHAIELASKVTSPTVMFTYNKYFDNSSALRLFVVRF